MEEDAFYVQEDALCGKFRRRRDPCRINQYPIFDTNIDTKAHSLLEIGLKRQVLYYSSLHLANVKQLSRGEWSWPSEFVLREVSSILIQTWKPMNNPQAQNSLVLSLKTTHQMDDSAIKKNSESDIVMSITQEEFFRALAVRCLLSDESLVLRNLSDATEMLQRTRNKLEIL